MIEINTQSSIKIDNFYFDPFKIGIETNDAKIVFITHAHYDHFDIDSIKKVINDHTIIVIPNDDEIKKCLTSYNTYIVEPGKEYEIDGIKFKTVRAYNTNKPFHKKEYNWIGYILYLDKTYYIMGDTDDTLEAREVKCDYLFIPVGGTYTMDYKEAANLTNYIKPKTVTPIHYGSIVGEREDGERFEKLVDSNIEVKKIINNI